MSEKLVIIFQGVALPFSVSDELSKELMKRWISIRTEGSPPTDPLVITKTFCFDLRYVVGMYIGEDMRPLQEEFMKKAIKQLDEGEEWRS